MHHRDRVDGQFYQLIIDKFTTIALLAITFANTRPVSWQWGSGKPGGVASEVATEGELTMETKNGNEVKKKAEPENPAVHVERSGHDVLKRASELEVEEKGDKSNGDAKDEKKDDSDKKEDEAEKKSD